MVARPSAGRKMTPRDPAVTVNRVPELPPPLPPETRTVGQLVAEAIRLYGRRFWPSLALGIPLAAADLLAVERPLAERVVVVVAFAPLFTVSYSVACVLAAGERPPAGRWPVAIASGTLVFVPAALLLPWFALAAVAWLALAGLVVPVALLEGVGVGAALRRAVRLGRADYVHAVGALATLVLVFAVTRLPLGVLLQSQAENTTRVALFLADLVLAPLIFLGSAILYFDQAARAVDSRRPRRRRRRDADLHPAHEPDRTGRADAEVEPRPPARGQPRRRRARG
jgi:hypothetical protein